MDLSSVLSSIFFPLPSYRYTSLYPMALDFVNAVRSYGAALQRWKRAMPMQLALQQATQQQLLTDGIRSSTGRFSRRKASMIISIRRLFCRGKLTLTITRICLTITR